MGNGNQGARNTETTEILETGRSATVAIVSLSFALSIVGCKYNLSEKGLGSENPGISKNAELSALEIGRGIQGVEESKGTQVKMTPGFKADISDYEVSLPASANPKITLKVKKAYSKATLEVRVNDELIEPLEGSAGKYGLTLSDGVNTVRIEVSDSEGSRLSYVLNIRYGVCGEGFFDDGESCVPFSSGDYLECGEGGIPVGIYGRSAGIVDQIGLRCAPYEDGVITGPAFDGPAVGGGGGGTFNLAGENDCPAGFALHEVDGNYGNFYGVHTGRLRYRCRNLDSGELSGWTMEAGTYWGLTQDAGNFSFACADTSSGRKGTLSGLALDQSDHRAFAGKVVGVTCM